MLDLFSWVVNFTKNVLEYRHVANIKVANQEVDSIVVKIGFSMQRICVQAVTSICQNSMSWMHRVHMLIFNTLYSKHFNKTTLIFSILWIFRHYGVLLMYSYRAHSRYFTWKYCCFWEKTVVHSSGVLLFTSGVSSANPLGFIIRYWAVSHSNRFFRFRSVEVTWFVGGISYGNNNIATAKYDICYTKLLENATTSLGVSGHYLVFLSPI